MEIAELSENYSYGVASTEKNNYLYNGKEKQNDFNLDWLDYGARMYDAALGRWWVQDPLAEKRFWLSPYQYSQNSPITRFDADGRLDDWYITGEGDLVYNRNQQGDFYTETDLSGNITKTYTKIGEDNLFGSKAVEGKEYMYITKDYLEAGNTLSHQGADYNLNTACVGNCHPSEGITLPDYLAVSGSGNLYVGGGVGADITLAYIKGDGLFVNASVREGMGFDVSGGVSVTAGYHTGDGEMNGKSVAGTNVYENGGLGPLNIGAQQDMQTVSGVVGKNWSYFSVGVTLGSKTVGGGSVGLSHTTNPGYLYKEIKEK